MNRVGNKYGLEQLGQQFDLADGQEVKDGAGIGHCQTHQKPRRCKLWRSRSASSLVYSIQTS